MIKAIIFDLDGSMIDSMWMWRAIDIEYLRKFGLELPEDLQNCIEGMTFHETAVYFKERFQIPDSLEEIKDEWNRMAWDKYASEVPMKDGVWELLRYCKKNDIRMGIASSNSRKLVENIVRTHRLEEYFTCIMTGCDVEKGKPSPDIYLAVAKAFGVRPQECLVFEDIIVGILAGKAAGMQVCAVYDRYSEHQDEEKRRLADYYTYDFREIIGILAAEKSQASDRWKLKVLDEDFSVCKVADYSQVNLDAKYCFIGKTDEEQSLVCMTSSVPDNVTVRDDGWKAFRIEGILDFSLIGVLSKITALLAENEIGIFAISTYNTDYVLTKKENFERAVCVLSNAGYRLL